MDLVTALVKGFCDGAEPWHIIFVRPSVGVEFVASRTQVVRFLEELLSAGENRSTRLLRACNYKKIPWTRRCRVCVCGSASVGVTLTSNTSMAFLLPFS